MDRSLLWLTRGSIGGTQGQYDGFDYLGGGVLLLLGVVLWRDARHILLASKRQVGLVIVLFLLTIWALSN